MLQREVFPKYREYSKALDSAYDYIKSCYKEDSIEDLCKYRGYVEGRQAEVLKQIGVGYCELDSTQLVDYPSELHLLTKNMDFLLNFRFIIPVYDIAGNLVSLIGYYPDRKKYITLPTPFFSKSCMFFNFKQAYELSWGSYDGFVILVEGIFDCLSLRSINLPAIATMGSSVSAIKGELLKLFKKVIAIPDDDVTGRRALDRYSKTGWKVPSNTTFIKFDGGYLSINGVDLHCKDMDNFVSWYDEDDVREVLLSYRDSKEEIEELKL